MKRKLTCLWRKMSVLFLVFFLMGAAHAQSLVTGKVMGADGKPLTGATVQEKGKKNNTLTDENGEFQITVGGTSSVLLFSNIGYADRQIKVGNQSVFSITLAQNSQDLSEVVVTALGVKKETRRLGYSVQEIKGADLTKARDANPINSLAGKIAGLTVGPNPEMLGRPELVLRGSKDLLFVVDGVPINSDTWNIVPTILNHTRF